MARLLRVRLLWRCIDVLLEDATLMLLMLPAETVSLTLGEFEFRAWRGDTDGCQMLVEPVARASDSMRVQPGQSLCVCARYPPLKQILCSHKGKGRDNKKGTSPCGASSSMSQRRTMAAHVVRE